MSRFHMPASYLDNNGETEEKTNDFNINWTMSKGIKTRETEYVEKKSFKLFIGTWNINDNSPNTNFGSIADHWLSVDKDPPHIYAIGFQELDNDYALVLRTDRSRADEWNSAVAASLHPKSSYRLVQMVNMGPIMMVVYVRSDSFDFVSEVSQGSVATGVGRVWWNKGGVVIRLKFHNTTLCFVNCHLAAHVPNVEKRNEDFHRINNNMKLNYCNSIVSHDQVYWFGDLNYRLTINDGKTFKTILDSTSLENWKSFLNNDQLFLEMKAGRVLVGYSEGQIKFKPSYRFDIGTDDWDTSEKERTPAWTDRILSRGEGIHQLAYRRHVELKLSDHKPVSALYAIDVMVEDLVKKQHIQEEILKVNDKMENDALPQLEVDRHDIYFDGVRFAEREFQSINMINTGTVLVHFNFTGGGKHSRRLPPWISVLPTSGVLEPNESIKATFEVYIDHKIAKHIYSHNKKMQIHMILHLHNGRDIFISVSALYKMSCFGSSLETLVHLKVPITHMDTKVLDNIEHKKSSITCDDDKANFHDTYDIPKEIWLLCDLVASLGLKQKHLFMKPGVPSEFILIRDWLDVGQTDMSPSAVSIHSAIYALVIFLQSLRVSVIPEKLHEVSLEKCNSFKACRALIYEKLKPVHRNVFLYVCAFFRDILFHSESNGVNAKILAYQMASFFMPEQNSEADRSTEEEDETRSKSAAYFMFHFLVNQDNSYY